MQPQISDRPDLAKQEAYWRKQLAGPFPVSRLVERSRPPVQSFFKRRESLELDKALVQGVRELSSWADVTQAVVLLAAWKTLLLRYTNQEDILVGSIFTDSLKKDEHDVWRPFANPVTLRTRATAPFHFLGLLRAVAKTLGNAAAHRDYPFEKVIEFAREADALNRAPIFQVMFLVGERSLWNWGVVGKEEWPQVEPYTTPCDLVLAISRREEILTLDCEYDAELFENNMIRRLLRHFQVLLKGIVSDPERRLWDLPMLTKADLHQLLTQWNNTGKAYPRDKCLHQLFEEQAERTPDAPAVVFPSTSLRTGPATGSGQAEDQRLTYRDLNRRANQLAHYLRKLGVGPEVLVGICMDRSLEMVIALLGILKAGGAYVPLDPAYPKERLAFMLDNSRPLVVLTQQTLLSQLRKTTGDGRPKTGDRRQLASSFPPSAMHRPIVVCLDSDWEAVAQESEDNLVNQTVPENLAYVIYTSGSTGRPKGVMIQHASLLNLITWHQRVYRVKPADRATQLANLSFDASAWEVWPYLTAGASIHLPSEEARVQPSKLLEWLEREGITICFLPTPLAEAVLEEQWPDAFALRTLLTGGDKLHQVPRRALPFELANNYGPTENTVVATWTPVLSGIGASVPPPIGRPIDNVQIYLLDSCLNPVPVGIPGELYIGGAGLAMGYLNQPELTAEKFIPNPFSDEPGARLYRTGDLTRYLPDGNIEFLGRIDHQVKIRGFRIELGEIETVLCQHAAVEQTVVTAREDIGSADHELGMAEDGHDNPKSKIENPKLAKRLVAYVVPGPKQAPTNTDLRSFLKEKLPDYMIPSAFVFLDKLPLTLNGKVDSKGLPPLDQTRPELRESFVAPRTPTEKTIAEIWAQVLKVDQVGIHDDFFNLGGHSLLAAQIIFRIREAFRVDIPLRTLFENSTLTSLAERVEALLCAVDGPALDGSAEEREQIKL